ncbi:MAG: agmatinase family protein [Chloroflexi bacterium]|nr:agmatinase family protein [Chloroflexota bacterium]
MKTPIPYLNPPSVTVSVSMNDEHEVRFLQILRGIADLEQADAALVGFPFDGGTVGGRAGSRHAPREIRLAFTASRTYDPHLDVELSDSLTVVDAGDIAVVYTNVQRTLEQGQMAIARLLQNKAVPIIIGGDHLITYPCLRALMETTPGRIGVINFDSHFDVRVSSGGEISSGTPFRMAMERSGGKFSPRNFVEIGPHGFHTQRVYRRYLDEQGCLLFTSHDVHRRGIHDVLEQVIARATDGVDALYVSVDIDVLDMAWAPGTNNPTPGGLTALQILEAVAVLGRHPLTRAFDLVEISPPLDVANTTVIMGREIVMNFLGGLALRKQVGYAAS